MLLIGDMCSENCEQHKNTVKKRDRIHNQVALVAHFVLTLKQSRRRYRRPYHYKHLKRHSDRMEQIKENASTRKERKRQQTVAQHAYRSEKLHVNTLLRQQINQDAYANAPAQPDPVYIPKLDFTSQHQQHA